MSNNKSNLTVEDMGAAAYLNLHGYKISSKNGRQYVFEAVAESPDARSRSRDFNRTKFDYLSSQFHDFDAKLMSLKKMGDYRPDAPKGGRMFDVDDLGEAAYLNMNGFKIIGKDGTVVHFEVNQGDEGEFGRHRSDYISSPYFLFDSKLRYLRKLNQLPDRERA